MHTKRTQRTIFVPPKIVPITGPKNVKIVLALTLWKIIRFASNQKCKVPSGRGVLLRGITCQQGYYTSAWDVSFWVYFSFFLINSLFGFDWCIKLATQQFLSRIRTAMAVTRVCFLAQLNPLMGTLKPQSNKLLYRNTMIGTLAFDGWAVTFGTARRGLSVLRPRPVPPLAVPNVTAHP